MDEEELGAWSSCLCWEISSGSIRTGEMKIASVWNRAWSKAIKIGLNPRMTLCRSDSFDSLFRNSEGSQSLRLILFWQQCQQRKPREFQRRYQETSAQSVLAPKNTETHEGKPSSQNRDWTVGRELHWGQKSSINICSANVRAASGACPHMAVKGWVEGTTLLGIHSPYPSAPLPAFSVLKFLSTWLNPQGLELSVQEKYKHFACCSLLIYSTMTPFFLSIECLYHQQRNTCYLLNRALQ